MFVILHNTIHYTDFNMLRGYIWTDMRPSFLHEDIEERKEDIEQGGILLINLITECAWIDNESCGPSLEHV